MRKLSLLAILITLLAFTVVAPTAAQDETLPTIADMIAERATSADAPEFTILNAALDASDPVVRENLAKPWNFTAFLPNDAAFEAFFAEAGMSLETLEPALVADVLRYHFLAGQYTAVNLSAQPEVLYGTHLANNPLYITADGETVMINEEASVVEADIQAGNGVIHIIDRVLIPPLMLMDEAGNLSMPEATPEPDAPAAEELKPIFEVAAANENFTTIAMALEAGGLKDTLSKMIPYTVFLPTNEAVEALLTSMNVSAEDLLATPETLTPILQYHAVSGKIDLNIMSAVAASLVDGVPFGTQLPGTALTVTMDGETLMVNGAAVLEVIPASNGVIYVIDTVLLPQ